MSMVQHLQIIETQNGMGVVAGKKIKKGEIIFQFRGNVFNSEQLPVPYSTVKDYYVQIGKDLYLGPSGEADDFFNHSCNPNAGLIIAPKGVFLIAIKNIKNNEEITWDYSTTMAEDDWEMECNCKSKQCRKRIRDFKYLPQDVQKYYITLGIVPSYIIENLS